MTMADAYPTGMTADDYLTLPETMQRMDLIEGTVYVSPSPTDAHQQAIGASAVFLLQLGKGRVGISPLDVRLDERNVVQPDVFWVSEDNPNCRLIDGKYWQGPPDLVVEVVHACTLHRDCRDKFDLYERHGVREYWLVEPLARSLCVYTLQDGKFARMGAFRATDTFLSPALGNIPVKVQALLGGR